MLLTAPPPTPSTAQRRSFLPSGWKSPPTPSAPPGEPDWPGLAHALLKQLSLSQMERLAEAVERGGASPSDCLHLSERCLHLGRYGVVDIVQLVCRLWRWPKAPPDAQVVNYCDEEEETDVCINPYHWSLRLDCPSSHSGSVTATALLSPPSPMIGDKKDFLCEGWPLDSLTTKDPGYHHSTEDSAIASSVSTEPLTSDFYSGAPYGGGSSFGCGEDASPPSSCPPPASSPHPPVWCSLSYWELLTHVGGHWFPVRRPRLHLSAASSFATRPPSRAAFLDLGALQSRQPPLRQPMAPLEADLLRCVSRARRRIGAGLVLVRRGGLAWLHNLSAAPVFVSPQCGGTGGGEEGLSARRLPPEHALALFDLELWRRRQRHVKSGRGALACAPPGPIDPRVVHVSFGKGWGQNYKRQDITLCPCRLEILFHLPKA